MRLLTLNRLYALSAAGVLAFAALMTSPLGASADVPTSVGNYNSRAFANGVHLVGDSSAFPNFEGPNSKGAVDNHYPLARVTQDASPSSHAVATYSDVGPLGATVAACSQADQTKCPPVPGAPYANSDYPGGKAKDHVDSCTPSQAASGQANPCPNNQPASYADTSVSELMAAASGYYAGGGAQPFSGASSDSTTTVGDDGSLTVHSHGAVQSATFGPFQIQKVDVLIDVVSAGGQVTRQDVKVTVGSVTLNGQPVTVTDQGVTAGQKVPIPCPSTSPLPLGGGTCTPGVATDDFKVYTVKPEKTVSGSHATIQASGLHVLVTHPTVPGAPTQSVEYILGEAYVDAFLDPAQTSPTDNGGGGVVGDTGGGDYSGGDFGGGGDAGTGSTDFGATAAAPVPPAHHLATVLAANRQPLALLFLFWEALVLGAAAAWVWARRKPVLAELEADA